MACSQDTFPDPKGLSDELHSKGFKGVWMLDPGLKAEKGYFAYDTGCENDVWIQTADGKPYVGMCHVHGETFSLHTMCGVVL